MIEKSNLFERIDMSRHIRESNLIEGVDDPFEDRVSGLAWKYLAAQPRLSRDMVLNVHRFITINSLNPNEAGHNRSVNVWVGSRQCPAPYQALLAFNEWIAEMRSWKTLDAEEMHIKFEKIHPFIDGNGRTGRMLMWWHQMKRGKEPRLIENSKKQLYYMWFQEDQK